ncbi:MAG: hypothetical protein M1823_000249 [Watsoniomyces obsoletus]|nr:MAG: hypothetical protein M1823_000249 [Watsoniomyces obsoletus]
MSTSTPLDPAGQPPPDPPVLAPDSYTAQRLQHASPEHLHLTTRSCFIGPVPDGWLKSHRKQWYRHHLHMGRSSRPTPTSTRKAISRIRQLSGLDGPSASAIYSNTFPQPDDADEDDDEEEELEQEEVTTDDPPAIDVPRSTALVPDGAQEGQENGTGSASRSPDSKKGSARDMKASTTSGSESYQTAGTTLEGEDGAGDKKPRAQNEESDQDSRPPAAPTMSQAFGENLTQRNSGSTASGMATIAGPSSNSKTSLLPHSQVDGGNDTATEVRSASNREQADSASHTAASDDQGPHAIPIPTSKVPAATPALVRFNLPGELAEDEHRAKMRLAQLSRRRSLRRARRGRKHDGEIAKVEKMLVKIEATMQDLPEEYDENESLSVDTKTVQKWQEFVVVCREMAGPEADFVLQLYRSRVIPANPKTHRRMRPLYEIILNRRNAKVNLYSALDKTVVVWTTKKSHKKIYILRPRSLASSVEWYTFLRNTLGWNRPRELQVNVPELSLTLYLENPFQQLEAQRVAAQASDLDDAAILKTMQAEQAVAGNIIKRCMDMLEKDPQWTAVLQKWSTTKKMGLAWKRYDRLEWVHGAHEQKMYGTVGMQKSHELELRPKEHYPTTVPVSAGRHVPAGGDVGGGSAGGDKKDLTEPPAVEGFLIRLTSQRGKERSMGRMFHKRLYFSTHDEFLCFSTPANAIPPPPPRLPVTENANIPSARQIREHMPLIYAIDPFPLTGGTISWVNDEDATRIRNHDQDAFDEAERRVNTLLRADGYVDLCKVIKVRNVLRGSVPADRNVSSGDAVDFNEDVSDTERDDGVVTEFDDNRTFELVLRNGLIVRLEAFDATTKREWVKRLRELVRYWKLRKAADLELLSRVRQANLAQLHIDEMSESYVGQFAKKWEVSQSIASGEMFHMCGISCCRTVAMSGYLYWKPRRRSTFRRCSVILSHGQLLLFESVLRNRSGQEIAFSHQSKLSSIDLKDCYIYSGLITEGDLLYQNQTTTALTDSVHPGRHALPRVYLDEDMGWWTSSDDDLTTCFVIWRALRKSYFRGDDIGGNGSGNGSGIGIPGDDQLDGTGGSGMGAGKKRQQLKQVTALGVPGRSIVFKARSRSERDKWVMSISTEIERCEQLAGQEIRVVEK